MEFFKKYKIFMTAFVLLYATGILNFFNIAVLTMRLNYVNKYFLFSNYISIFIYAVLFTMLKNKLDYLRNKEKLNSLIRESMH